MNGSYVSGPLAISYSAPSTNTFPVGAGGNARSVTVGCSVLTGIGSVTVQQFESAMGGTLPASTTQFGNRYWTVSQTGISAMTYSLTLDGTDYSPANTAVMLQQGSPDVSYSTTFSSPYYTATGIGSVGNFTLGNYVPAAFQLVFTNNPLTLTAGAVGGPFIVQLQNSGTPYNSTSNLTVTLLTSSPHGVFSNANNSAQINSVVISNGTSSASFNYLDTLSGTPIISVSSAGANPTNQQETVNAAVASALTFTSQPGNAIVSSNFNTVVVQLLDPYGNSVLQNGTAIGLTLNNGGSDTLTGTIPQSTDGTGKATFSDLAVTGVPVSGVTLTAASGGLASTNSSNFNITSKIFEKAGNTTALNAGTSWVGGNIPGTNDTAQIDNTSCSSSATTADTGGANQSWYGLNIVGWSYSHGYIVSDNTGGDVITLGAGGLVGSSLTHTISFNNGFALGAPQTWIWGSGSGTLTVAGNIDNGGYKFNLNVVNPIVVSGIISDAGGLTKTGNGTLTLDATNTYTGDTVISNGTVVLGVSGSIASTNIVISAGATFDVSANSSAAAAAHQILTGNGSVNGPAAIDGTLAPGYNTIGTITVKNGLTLDSNSIAIFRLNKSLSQSNDLVVVPTGSINVNGTLVVTNLGPTPVLGDSFTLFSQPVSGAFTNVILPSLSAGYAWTNLLAVDGTIDVVNMTTVNTNPTNITVTVSGNVLQLSWPADHTGWRLLVQTNNLATGISSNTNDWTTVLGSTGINQTNIPINVTQPTEFYRLAYP